RPPNLVVIVWDNEQNGTTGGQPTATAQGADLAAAARAFAVDRAEIVRSEEQLRSAVARARTDPGPWLIVAKVTEPGATAKPSLDNVGIKERFMTAIFTSRPAAIERS